MVGPESRSRVTPKLEDNFVSVRIGNCNTRAIIDTGAHRSCISLSFVRRLKLQNKIIKTSDRRKLFTADGRPLKVIGTIYLTINIEDLLLPATFQVIDRLNYDALLGMQFLSDTNANIDIPSKTLTLYDGLVDTKLMKSSDTLLRTINAVTIPARSEALIPVSVPRCFDSKEAIVEPSANIGKRCLALAKAIVHPEYGRTVCKVLNPTNVPILLKRRTTIAVIEHYPIDYISVIEDTVPNDIVSGRMADPVISMTEQKLAIKKKGISLDQNDLTDAQFERLVHLIYMNLDLFATSMQDLVGTDVVRMDIDTGDAAPIRKRPYRQSPQIMQEMRKQVEEMEAADIVESSDSPWNSPCLLIKKSGGNEYRFVNDLREVNKLTRPVFWPMPTITDIVDTISDKSPTRFTKLDMKNAYFQILLTDESKPKTAFSVAGKHYQYKRMVQGLSNSAQCWQRLLTKVLSDMLFKSAIVYLDDVLLLSRDFDEHFGHLTMLFDKFRQARLRMNGKKCKFATDGVQYLGHYISAQGIVPDSSRTEIIINWPRPQNQKQIKSFLGVTGFYRRHVPNYSLRSAPLRDLLAKDKPFVWGDAQEDAFTDLKNVLIKPPVLEFPVAERVYYLQCDAANSDKSGIGYVLGQIDELGHKHVISYGGRGLRACERRWCITQLEALALLTGIRENHIYLAGRPFIVYTDHVSLKYLQSLKVSANNRLARWALALQPYTFEVRYKEGRKLTAADGISRRPYPEPQVDETDDDDELAEDSYIAQIDVDVFDGPDGRDGMGLQTHWHEITFEYAYTEPYMTQSETLNVVEQEVGTDITDTCDIQTLQRKCPDLIPFFQYLEDGVLPQDDKAARKLVFEAEQFVIDNGVLYHIFHPRSKRIDQVKPVIKQLCLPRELREPVLKSYHDNNCHIGQERLYNTLKLKYYFPFMFSCVLKYVASCERCQQAKTSTHRKRAPLRPLEVVPPFHRVHIDFVGPLPETSPDKFQHLLVVVDSTTLWPEAFPLKSTTAEEVARTLYKDIIARHGLFQKLVTDGARSFRNKLITELCKLLKIKHTITSAYNPAANSKVERMNQSLIRSMKLITEKQSDWAEYVTPVLMSYRASVTSSTGVSPYYAIYGREMQLGIDLQLLQEMEKSTDLQSYTSELIPRLRMTHDIIQQNLKDNNDEMKRRYDQNTQTPNFQLGDKVMVFQPAIKKSECAKLKSLWSGPSLIVYKSDDGLSYKLKNCVTGKESHSFVHSNRLKPFNEDRDLLYSKYQVTPQPQTAVTDVSSDDSSLQTADQEADDWLPIQKIVGRKKVNSKVTYKVLWMDGTTSWLPARDVTEFAKNSYIIEKRQKSRKRRQ